MLRTIYLALLVLAGLYTAHADGLAPAGASAQGLCYTSGSSGPTVPCILQGQTWTRVLRPADPGDALTVTAPGGVPRPQSGRAGDRISILDYGGSADYDGSAGTDNLTAFNKAAATGKCVWFPPGRYYFSASTAPLTNTTLCVRGDTVETTQLVFAASATSCALSATQADFRWQVQVSDLSLKTIGSEAGTALCASWSDADATFNVNQRRLTVSNVVMAGRDNQAQGWRRGLYAKNAQAMVIDNVVFVGRTTTKGPNGTQVEADLTHADEGFYLDNGSFGTLGGYISRIRVLNAKSCLTVNSDAASIEGININQYDCVGVSRGIFFNTFKDSPGLVVANGHINAFECGICGSNFTQSIISNLLVYKIQLGPGRAFACIDAASSDNLTVSGMTCINQAPNTRTRGIFYGIRLTDSNYAQLYNNTFNQPTCGVVIAGSSSENIGQTNVTAGQIAGGSTSAVCDTSGGNNTIGTGAFRSQGISVGDATISTSGVALASSLARSVFPGQRYRVTASMQINNDGSATEAIMQASQSADSAAVCDFGTVPNQIQDRRPSVSGGVANLNASGVCTVTRAGSLRFVVYGTSVGASGLTPDKGAKIAVEQL